MITINEAKLYLRLDEDDDTEDNLIDLLISTAEEYIKSATGFKFENSVPERAKMIALFLVSHWYENRSITQTGKQVARIDMTARALIEQLRYSHNEDEYDAT
ncbi:head-tail connector protein [Alkalihalophilus marmarensis]|uniref:DNA packaging protein n=1 Tax=Alkalihalophilus marmarensis DSM 21297 TaxID=1188261 RepID=U6SRU0_9BACI|nr:head-tail connector protein [Alkalihalophilus marmarensis]ERN54102.1 DNA packaging protein [Alkalihalophilus marmarensis DSM 21297]